MTVSPEDLVRIVQDTINTSECDNPITFEPPDWVIRAMRRAYDRGLKDGKRTEEPKCSRCGRAECLRRALPCDASEADAYKRGLADGGGLYPEGG